MGQKTTFAIEAPATEKIYDTYVFSGEKVHNSDDIYHTIDRDPNTVLK